jgi:hypothetical protein
MVVAVGRLTDMTLTATTEALAAQVRNADPTSEPVLAALQLSAHAWLAHERPAADELRWGLFGTTVLEVAAMLFPGPPPIRATFDSGQLGDGTLAAVRVLTEAVADTLETASQRPNEGRAWQYAEAAAELRKAVEDLQ